MNGERKNLGRNNHQTLAFLSACNKVYRRPYGGTVEKRKRCRGGSGQRGLFELSIEVDEEKVVETNRLWYSLPAV